MRSVWSRLALTALLAGTVGCTSSVPTGSEPTGPIEPSAEERSIQANQSVLSPDALRAALPERIAAADVDRQLVRIDANAITGLEQSGNGAAMSEGGDRSIQQRRASWRGGWGGRGWRGGYRSYGWRGYGGYGYSLASYYYPYGGYYYPYYLYGGYYYPYYADYAGYYYYPSLYRYRGYYRPYTYWWH